MSLPATLTINGVEYHRDPPPRKARTRASSKRGYTYDRVRLPKNWKIPTYWIARRYTEEHVNDLNVFYMSAARIDGVSVGRNGSWHYTLPDDQSTQVGHFSCVEHAIFAAEKASPFDPDAVTWPRLVWITPEGEDPSMAYALLYGYKKKKEGLYELDCLRTVREQTYDKHDPERPHHKMWGPEAEWRPKREKVLGTVGHLFVGDRQLEEEGRRLPGYFRRVPKGTEALLKAGR